MVQLLSMARENSLHEEYMVWRTIFKAVLGMEDGGKLWDRALFKEDEEEDNGGKQICRIRTQSLQKMSPSG